MVIRVICDNVFELAQPHFIDRIIKYVDLDHDKANSHENPVWKPLLNKYLGGVPRNSNFS